MSRSAGANQALRFLLEVAALIALAYWGWTAHGGVWRVTLAVGLPVVTVAVWAVFRVPDDPGPAPVPVSGPLRLLVEFALFGLAAALLAAAGRPLEGAVFAALVALHYVLDRARIRWLLGHR